MYGLVHNISDILLPGDRSEIIYLIKNMLSLSQIKNSIYNYENNVGNKNFFNFLLDSYLEIKLDNKLFSNLTISFFNLFFLKEENNIFELVFKLFTENINNINLQKKVVEFENLKQFFDIDLFKNKNIFREFKYEDASNLFFIKEFLKNHYFIFPYFKYFNIYLGYDNETLLYQQLYSYYIPLEINKYYNDILNKNKLKNKKFANDLNVINIIENLEKTFNSQIPVNVFFNSIIFKILFKKRFNIKNKILSFYDLLYLLHINAEIKLDKKIITGFQHYRLFNNKHNLIHLFYIFFYNKIYDFINYPWIKTFLYFDFKSIDDFSETISTCIYNLFSTNFSVLKIKDNSDQFINIYNESKKMKETINIFEIIKEYKSNLLGYVHFIKDHKNIDFEKNISFNYIFRFIKKFKNNNQLCNDVISKKITLNELYYINKLDSIYESFYDDILCECFDLIDDDDIEGAFYNYYDDNKEKNIIKIDGPFNSIFNITEYYPIKLYEKNLIFNFKIFYNHKIKKQTYNPGIILSNNFLKYFFEYLNSSQFVYQIVTKIQKFNYLKLNKFNVSIVDSLIKNIKNVTYLNRFDSFMPQFLYKIIPYGADLDYIYNLNWEFIKYLNPDFNYFENTMSNLDVNDKYKHLVFEFGSRISSLFSYLGSISLQGINTFSYSDKSLFSIVINKVNNSLMDKDIFLPSEYFKTLLAELPDVEFKLSLFNQNILISKKLKSFFGVDCKEAEDYFLSLLNKNSISTKSSFVFFRNLFDYGIFSSNGFFASLVAPFFSYQQDFLPNKCGFYPGTGFRIFLPEYSIISKNNNNFYPLRMSLFLFRKLDILINENNIFDIKNINFDKYIFYISEMYNLYFSQNIYENYLIADLYSDTLVKRLLDFDVQINLFSKNNLLTNNKDKKLKNYYSIIKFNPQNVLMNLSALYLYIYTKKNKNTNIEIIDNDSEKKYNLKLEKLLESLYLNDSIYGSLIDYLRYTDILHLPDFKYIFDDLENLNSINKTIDITSCSLFLFNIFLENSYYTSDIINYKFNSDFNKCNGIFFIEKLYDPFVYNNFVYTKHNFFNYEIAIKIPKTNIALSLYFYFINFENYNIEFFNYEKYYRRSYLKIYYYNKQYQLVEFLIPFVDNFKSFKEIFNYTSIDNLLINFGGKLFLSLIFNTKKYCNFNIKDKIYCGDKKVIVNCIKLQNIIYKIKNSLLVPLFDIKSIFIRK